MAGLKRWWFEKAIIPQVQQSHYFHGRSNQHIGVITDVCMDFPKLDEFINSERAKNNKINVLKLKLDKSVTPVEEAAYSISKKNVNFYGVPKGEAVNYFLDHNYDICYFLLQEVSLPAEFLLRTVKSGLKLGFSHKELIPYLDFSTDSNEEINKQLHYLLEATSKLLFGIKKPAGA